MSSPNALTTQPTDFDDDLISSTRYQNAIAALREAARIGIADIEAGRFVTFDSDAQINQHLAALVSDAGST